MNYIKKNMFRNLYKKLSKNITFWIAIGLLVIILFVFVYHIFIKSRVSRMMEESKNIEGFSGDTMTVVPVQLNSDNAIQTIEIQPNIINPDNQEWLNLSELRFYKSDNKTPLVYGKGKDYTINSSNGIYSNDSKNYGFEKLSDGYYSTIFASGGKKCTLTVTFTPATNDIYYIVIRNRFDGSWTRIANYSMSIKDANKKKLCNDIQLSNPALYNNQSVLCKINDQNCNENGMPNHKYDNVITYKLVPTPPGPQGPRGKDGPQGPPGPKGQAAYGHRGDDGIPGITGIVGPTGKQGNQGPDGIAGPIGMVGIPGENGPLGPTGPPGKIGSLQSIVNT